MRLLGKLAIGGVVLVGVAAAAFWATEARLAEALRSRIEAQSGLRTQIGATRFGFASGLQVSASDVRLFEGAATTPLLTIERADFAVPLTSLFGGAAEAQSVTLTRPTLRLVRDGTSRPPHHGAAETRIGDLTIIGGSLHYDDKVAGVEARLDALDLHLTPRADGTDVDATVTIGSKRVRLHGNAAAADPSGTHLLEAQVDGLTPAPVALRSGLRLQDGILRFDDLLAKFDTGQVRGAGMVDFGHGAPLLTAGLALDRFDIGTATADLDTLADQDLDLRELRLVDAKLDLALDQLWADGKSLGALKLQATTERGLLRVVLPSTAAFGGQVDGELSLDGSQQSRGHRLRLGMADLDVSPLFAAQTGLRPVRGRLGLQVDLRSNATRLRDAAADLAGMARLDIRNATLVGLDVPAAARSVAAYLPPAWRALTDRIDVDAVTADFNVARGIAQTDDLHIVSPTLDVVGKGQFDFGARTLDLRFDPRVSSAGPRRSPLDLGAAILLRGPWDRPTVSADLSGLARDPQGAIDTLQTLGQQFLGGGGGTSAGAGSDGAASGTTRIQPDDLLKGLDDLLGSFGGRPQMPQPRQLRPQPRTQYYRDGDNTGRPRLWGAF